MICVMMGYDFVSFPHLGSHAKQFDFSQTLRKHSISQGIHLFLRSWCLHKRHILLISHSAFSEKGFTATDILEDMNHYETIPLYY
jgi:hypothetical protein